MQPTTEDATAQLDVRFVLRSAGWVNSSHWNGAVELLRSCAILSLGITVLVASSEWSLENSIVADARFEHFSRHLYRADPYGNHLNVTQVGMPIAYSMSEQAINESGVTHMQQDRIYTVMMVLFLFFFVSEVLVSVQYLWWNSDKLGFDPLKDLKKAVSCTLGSILGSLLPCCISKDCCNSTGWGAVCCSALFQRIMLFGIPVVCFFSVFFVFYPNNWVPGKTIDSLNFFRAVLVIVMSISVMRLAVRIWVIETLLPVTVFEGEDADSKKDTSCKVDCSKLNRFRFWWCSNLLFSGALVMLLIWESWLDKDSWAEHRNPSTTPPNWMFWPVSMLLVAAWALAFVFEVDALVHPGVGNTYKATRCIEFVVAAVYGYFFITILLHYKNDYDSITQCGPEVSTDPQCGCNECALTAWVFRKLNNPTPLSSASLGYPPNMEICYSNGYGNMAIGEYCKMRQDFPVLLGSFLVVGAALRGVLQICFFVDTSVVYNPLASGSSASCPVHSQERDSLVDSGFTQGPIRRLEDTPGTLPSDSSSPREDCHVATRGGAEDTEGTADTGYALENPEQTTTMAAWGREEVHMTDREAEQLLCAFREDSDNARV